MNGGELKQITFPIWAEAKRDLSVFAINHGFTSAREMFAAFALVMAESPRLFPLAEAERVRNGSEMRELRSLWCAVNKHRRARRQRGRAAE